MTLQETFNIVVQNLRRQRKQSLGIDGSCLYRSDDGLKCAAGWLIPDDKYSDSIEDKCADDESVACILEEEGHDVDLVLSLQRIHDDIPPSGWEHSWRTLANRFHLEMPPATTCSLDTSETPNGL